MNSGYATLCIVIALSACADNANVLSSDGTKIVTTCYAEAQPGWVKCISDACPNGFTIVDNTHQLAIVRCKP